MADNFQAYMAAKDRKEGAYSNYCYAGAKLHLAQIEERLAEIKSQHEPLASVIDKGVFTRDTLHAVAYYVVRGRIPTQTRDPAGRPEGAEEGQADATT
jgi:hypothetical protein